MFEATVWTLFDGECGKQRLLFGHCLRLLLGECGNRGYCLDIGQCLPHGRMFAPGSHHSASQCTAINSRQTSAVYSDTAHLFWPSKIYVTCYKETKWMHAKQILLWKWAFLEEEKEASLPFFDQC